MSYFWICGDGMDEIQPDYYSFHHFDLTHLMLIAVAAVIIAGTVLVFRRLSTDRKEKLFSVLTVLLLLDELIKYAITIGTNSWSWSYLPLHLCSINIFVCLAYTVTKKKFFAEMLYSLCLPGAAIALLVPTWNDLPIFNGMHLHSASVHIMLVMYPVLLLANGFKPDYKQLPKILGLLVCVCVPIFFLNKLIDTNFFFLSKTENNPVLELLASILGDKWFFLGLPVLLAAAWSLMYLPWVLAKNKKVTSSQL